MAPFRNLSFQPTDLSPLSPPLTGGTPPLTEEEIQELPDHEAEAYKIRQAVREQHIESHRAWTGLFQYETRQVRGESPEAILKKDLENEKMNVQLADHLNERVPLSNQATMASGSLPLKPLNSRITGDAIASFPSQLQELDDAEESHVNRMLWHLGITRHVPSPKEGEESVPRAREKRETNWHVPAPWEDSSPHREYTIREKRDWIRERWVGTATVTNRPRATLRDCFPAGQKAMTTINGDSKLRGTVEHVEHVEEEAIAP